MVRARAAARASAGEMPSGTPLTRYRERRDFTRTPEPQGRPGEEADSGKRGVSRHFVVQKHAARRLHYDFRLELDGVMKSWAVPKGPCLDPTVKRMAVQVEDHPLSYNSFEGTIPAGQYGAGEVIVWDRGAWEPVGDPVKGLASGKLVFKLSGHKLAGLWELIRIAKPGEQRQDPWLLFKKHDQHERRQADFDVISAQPDSVISSTPVPQQHSKASSSTAAGLALPASARKAALPERLSPQLATLAARLPDGAQWNFEIKFDGYRIMARVSRGQARLFTRGGLDWSERMPELAQACGRLGIKEGWLDGEIVVLGADGTPDFNALQSAFDGKSEGRIQYFIFDLPYFEGYDLRAVPLSERRALLHDVMQTSPGDPIRFSADFKGDPQAIVQSACQMHLEGIMAKRRDAPYVSARTDTWIKLKCRQRQEFVIAGYTDRGGAEGAAHIGSLILGVHDAQGHLVSAGNVGTGWDMATAAELKRRLVKIASSDPPFPALQPHRGSAGMARRQSRGPTHWVRPELVAEVSFSEWTPDGQIRHASFVGLRSDKTPQSISREEMADPSAVSDKKNDKGIVTMKATLPSSKTAPPEIAGVRVSHADRVIDAASGSTKLDVLRYYESVAAWLLPHLKGRPTSLVRGPDGVGGELFFQKHLDRLRISEVRELDPALWPGHASLIEVPSAKAVVACAQMNVIEFHTWNAKIAKIDAPDRMVFDLDPGEGVQWRQIQEAASLVKALLDVLGLKSWLKTSGGKGLHLVVPIAPRYAWDSVKDFSQAVVRHLASVLPDRFVAKSGAANREGKIFADYLRNGFGATTACAYSLRARPGLGVSMPVAWDQLSELTGGAQWTIANAREYLSFQRDDPWIDFWKARQPLTRAMKKLGVPAQK